MWDKLFKGDTTPEKAAENPLYQAVNRDRLPRHTAIIMDGNGRWAEGRGLLRTAGHTAGVSALKQTLKVAIDLGLPALTVYAFSTENWKRPHNEVDFLMRLFTDQLAKEIDEMDADGVRLRFLGRVDDLAPALREQARAAEARTKDNTGVCFSIAMNYGGQDELVRATQALAADVAAGRIAPGDIDAAAIEARLDTAGLPPVDLVIRTSGDLRLSNFLLWQAAYAEFWFTDTNWPDFTPAHFVEALRDYGRRERRFGGLKK
ncbi:MAG: di-trans,poly-cis-decaprenylcistransferase [Schwartzia sp.]|nr:di-trans,poly-cis-decaprenylcistransferase [Schwartzia sp. (in: firmicutes)]